MCNCCFKSPEMDFNHDLILFELLLFRKIVFGKSLVSKKIFWSMGGQKFKKNIIALFHVSGHSGHFLKRFIFFG